MANLYALMSVMKMSMMKNHMTFKLYFHNLDDFFEVLLASV